MRSYVRILAKRASSAQTDDHDFLVTVTNDYDKLGMTTLSKLTRGAQVGAAGRAAFRA